MHALVLSATVKKGRSGNYWQGDIKTAKETINAIIWEDESRFPKKNDFICVTQCKDQTETKFKNLVIKAFKKITKDQVPAEELDSILTIPGVPIERIEGSWKYLVNTEKYSDSQIGNFVASCLMTHQASFIAAPAAYKKHHNYKGGLAVHTAEVVLFAQRLLQGMPHAKYVNNDIVLAAATLHDLGKTKTYSLNELGLPERSDIESAIGHIYYSMSMVESFYDLHSRSAMSQELFNELMHVIAAHHGDVEKGSIKDAKTLEAIIVHEADYLSARVGEVESMLLYNENYHGDFMSSSVANLLQGRQDKPPQ